MAYKEKIKYVLSDWKRLKFLELKELKNCDDEIKNPFYRELSLINEMQSLITDEKFLNACFNEAKQRVENIELL